MLYVYTVSDGGNVETVETLRERLISRVGDDERVLGAWEETLGFTDGVIRAYLTLREETFASFYAERWSWISALSLPVLQQEVSGPYPVCLALTADGIGLWLACMPWGSIPEHPIRSPYVLVDKTGRLAERLRMWTPPERVDFRDLDYWAERVWYELWRMAMLSTHDVAGELYALAGALQSYLTFVAVCRGDDVESLSLQGELASWAQVNDAMRHLAPRELALVIAHLMSKQGRALGESRGWRYPTALEDAVESFWRARGWPTWRRRNAFSS